ncbi:hypothetical protein [Streptomyces yaizuensis]|uniref:Uncharacterized protein n=1 Tax=Streptomyces yaizuensis TaxID=2989713 RepID=A0ABQ5NXL1_9ACTN|nr:hypothetical protein [Streptomyces sp. YSPA8]GLF95110.1 hypothetical protein SYYSPA8_12455 [Streptomyces sp. YSPA8]
MDPQHTTLPDEAVLTALADLFQPGADERARWLALLTEARAARRRRRLQRPAPEGSGAPPVERLSPMAVSQRAPARDRRRLRLRPRSWWWRTGLVAAVLAAAAGAVVHGTGREDGAERIVGAPFTPAPLARTCSDWRPMAQAFVSVMPCLERRGDALLISVKVKAAPEGDLLPEGDAVVWLWLMRKDRAAEARKSFLRTRHESTLRRCPIPLHADGRITLCGPFRLPLPDRDGTYTTSTQARLHDAVHPPGWNDRRFTGTQGGELVWKMNRPVRPVR